jgi:hypothetical protein
MMPSMINHPVIDDQISRSYLRNTSRARLPGWSGARMPPVSRSTSGLLGWNARLAEAAGSSRRCTHYQLPLLLVGGAAGQIKGGRHLKYAAGTPMTNLHLAVLDKLGIPVENFGDSTRKLELLSDV